MFLRKTADFQEHIMQQGVDNPEKFRDTARSSREFDTTQFQPIFVGHLNTDDEVLKDKLKNMSETDWLILRGDKRDCLNPKVIKTSMNDLVN